MLFRSKVRVPAVFGIIMGGGRGTRLYPLVKHRCKPAVPLAGKYRLIDIPISNCLNSGINNLFVLTQFNSRSLNLHITRAYQPGTLGNGFVEIIAASQGGIGADGEDWFQGTADAVRRCLRYLPETRVAHVLILSGDQLYAMNFQEVLATHEDSGAEITIACKQVGAEDAPRLGIVGTESSGRINEFVEKPQAPEQLARVRNSLGGYWASMGIYLFNRAVLERILRENEGMDFGKDIIPYAVRSGYVVNAHPFDGYWEDIGTIGSFYATNLQMASPEPPIDLFDPNWDVYTRSRFLPPTKLQKCTFDSGLIADGCMLYGAELIRSVVGVRSLIREGSRIENSVVMGADFYVSGDSRAPLPSMGIGRNVVVRRAIIDKNVRIGDGARIANEKGLLHADGPNWAIRDGIVVVEKNAMIPPGTVI